ncbi:MULTISPECIES: hypothetical protein [Gordonia]|uniref:Uncharacterized protein n=1 Tax=Gordonia hongkongensis TaxID=1701090 RepID=A0ABT6C0V9_9ACTN|nr:MULTISPECIES: hypothetical protein [Gordonia]MCT1352832.1 hypothetical protein [Gordonia sp. p3-SID1431]MDF6103836.1 hypothetical protein [Gordonia hongkongensis]
MTSDHNPGLSPELRSLIEQINEPENQGVPLEMRDYALLCLVTVVIPAVLITLGMVLS